MRVLVVVHGYPPTARGGSEVYAEAHARTLRDTCGDDVLVLTRDADLTRPELDVRDTTHRGVRVVRINNTFRSVRSFEESYTQPRLFAVACELVDAFAPDVAHIHHLTCLSTLLPAHLHSRGVPCFMTLHDYWLLCHRGQLLDRDCRLCSEPGDCRNCLDGSAALTPVAGHAAAMVRSAERHLPAAGRTVLRKTANLLAKTMSSGAGTRDVAAARLAHMREVASHITRFYAPSAHLRDTFAAAGFPASSIQLSRYGFEADRVPRRPEPATPGPLRIGFIGSLMVSKAPHLLLEAFRRLPEGAATLNLFGAYVPYHGDDRYRTVLEPLLRTPGVAQHGWLPETEMRQAYANLDLLVVPSVWPENSPLVIDEAFLAGVPVVASDIGGIPELVRDNENGLLFPAGDVDALHAALLHLVNDRAELDRLARCATPVRSIADDTRAMRADYLQALRREPAGANPPGSGHVTDLKVGSYVQFALSEDDRFNVGDDVQIAGGDDDVHLDVGSDVQVAVGDGAPLESDSYVHVAARHVRVHAVVLNYRTPEQTLLAVRSLLASTPPLAAVLVVDNTETVACGRMLAELSDRVEYVSTAENLGYSGGMNVGIARTLAAGATHVLLVNSDVTVPPDCCTRLLDAMAAAPDAGIVGPTLLLRDTPDRIDSAGLRFDLTTGRMRMRQAGGTLKDGPSTARVVDAVSGCLMLVEGSVFERIGAFDERYFFGFEDLDFCLRARAVGFRTVVSPARAWHARAQSLAAHAPERLYYAARNHLLLSASPHGGGAGSMRQIRVLTLNLAHALTSPPTRIPARLRAVVAGALDFSRGRFGARG